MSNYVYLQHPVDKAEVRKYNEQGVKVLDIRFKPIDETQLESIEDQPVLVEEKPATAKKKPVKKAVKSRAKK